MFNEQMIKLSNCTHTVKPAYKELIGTMKVVRNNWSSL